MVGFQIDVNCQG